MRIGLFSDVYLPYINGVVTVVDDLKKSLEKKGHEVYIITINGTEDKHHYLNKNHIIRIPGLPLGVYDYSFRLTYPFKAIKEIKKLNLDIIHTHTEFNICRFGKSMAKKLDIPVVHTFHTLYDESMFYVTKGHFDKVSKKLVIAWVKNYLNDDIKEVMVPTDKVKDIFINRYKIKKNVHVIPSGINVEMFYKENIKQKELNKLKNKLGIKDSDFILAYIGRVGKEKRIDFLLENYVKLMKKYDNCKFLLVGQGPEEENLRHIMEKNNLLDRYIEIGKVPHEDIAKYYHLATVVATASHYETQGLTVVEAFAASKPVVCVLDDSFKVVKDNYNGRIFKNKKEYLNILEDLINNKDKVLELGKNAYITAQDYSLSSFADKVLGVYNKALEDYSRNKEDKHSKKEK